MMNNKDLFYKYVLIPINKVFKIPIFYYSNNRIQFYFASRVMQ